MNAGGDVVPGERIDIFATLYIQEVSGNSSGDVDIGFGFNGAEPLAGDFETRFVGKGYAGRGNAIAIKTDATLTSGDTIDIYIRRNNSSTANFGLNIPGNISGPHEALVVFPSGQGAATGGPSTDNRAWAIVDAQAGKVYPGLIVEFGTNAAVEFTSFSFRSTSGTTVEIEFFIDGVSMQAAETSTGDGTVTKIAVGVAMADGELVEMQVVSITGTAPDPTINAEFTRT